MFGLWTAPQQKAYMPGQQFGFHIPGINNNLGLV